MANLWSQTYDTIKAVSPSDTTDDPAGPFAGLLVSVAGAIKITTGLGDTPTFIVVAGQEIHTIVRRVWSTGTSATVLGLVGNIKRPGT